MICDLKIVSSQFWGNIQHTQAVIWKSGGKNTEN